MTFTKERLTELSRRENVGAILGEEIAELARIALASLEAEAVCVIDQSNLDYLKSGSDADVWPASRTEMGDVLLYRSATPAPVSVPDEVCWEDVPEEITEDDMALASAWAHGFNQCRAAMLKHSEPFIVTSDHRMMEMPQVEAINAVTAMLHGAEPVSNRDELPLDYLQGHKDGLEWAALLAEANHPQTGDWLYDDPVELAKAIRKGPDMPESRCGNSPVIPDGWVACSERMPENDDFVYIWPRPDFGVELHVAQYGKFDKRDAGWYAQVYEQNYGIEYYPVKVTHWMPLPAAPQRGDSF